ncbi:MAG TPA: prepilin-type N-terminal cleavage/methylation domain-containing protein [Clostridia bacterium]|nr:prepilin-type N-terminal cleavage/methylation domain-containing protein [Clostridia bacterium]
MDRPITMPFKSRFPRAFSEKAFSLIELLVALALLSMVLAMAYGFYFFAYGGWGRAEASSFALQEARQALATLDREVRSAQRGPDGQKAVQVLALGTQLDLYVNLQGDEKPELVRYLIREGRLERGLAFPDQYEDFQWQTVVSRLGNSEGQPPFTASDQKLLVELIVNSGNNQWGSRPVEVSATFTVRSKGAI